VGGELETLKRNIHALIRVKKRRGKPQPMIEAQCLVSRYSEKELTELERLARSMGVDRLRLKALWFMIPEISCASKEEVETLKRFLPTSDPLRWYNVENGKVIWSLSASRVSCDVAWLNTTFLWDGTVVPCCMDYNGDYAFGNIKTDHFGRIWNNPRYKEFRKTLLKRPHEISICRECPETRLRTEGFRYLF
jgi:radical SAM protein with 4Fe4S-binding SPASM domain